MGRGKDEFIRRTGGLRFGESQEQFEERVREIARLEEKFLEPGLTMQERERMHRRLCDLKGIDFDAPDEDDSE
jgi:hypothetical protein